MTAAFHPTSLQRLYIGLGALLIFVFMAIGLVWLIASRRDLTSFFAAVEGGDYHKVESMLDSDATLASVKDEFGSTGLNVAVRYGRSDIVKLLLDQGSDPYNNSFDHGMPLHLAALRGDLESVRHLLAAGVDPNRQPDGPLNCTGTALHSAAGSRNPAVVTELLRGGANVNAGDQLRGDERPLHEAVGSYRIGNRDAAREIIEILLDHGADVNATTNDGRTAYDYAKEAPTFPDDLLQRLSPG